MLVSFDDLLNLPQVRVVDALLTETEITLQVEHSQHFADKFLGTLESWLEEISNYFILTDSPIGNS